MPSTVLVVEDEFLIRLGVMSMIEAAGYDVLEASDADQAIALLETRPDIRVVFSDIEMPGGSMDGLKLIHTVRRRWPPAVLILTSGRIAPQVADMPERTVFLRKPYRDEELLSVLATVDWRPQSASH